ncbi:hypothetical protein [Alicyclobacillus ferrooxydans]|uniref:Uncharacterized protein n=1 Tax=Alicyclobacillus ferrooxydans TaxID=471514 RepID=A0A0P9CZW5_9BACL|nr:hypothetical protein [Alicyclobacillus ferrooxydans]KPV45281.1 hypothetical protein AN477_02575 [Alicyclobacillus ferrooxydans]
MDKQTGIAQVYSCIKIRHAIAYGLIVLAVLVVAMMTMAHLDSMHTRAIHWFDYDIPWLCEAALAWLPVLQRVLYRNVSVHFDLDSTKSVCCITGNSRFNGTWDLKKRSSEIFVIVKLLLPILFFLIVVDAATNVIALHRAVLADNNPAKAHSVQGLSQMVFLVGVFTPQITFYKYPFILRLWQKDRWLSLQYR